MAAPRVVQHSSSRSTLLVGTAVIVGPFDFAPVVVPPCFPLSPIAFVALAKWEKIYF